jgi:regulator of nucleoside diphosphate kinase
MHHRLITISETDRRRLQALIEAAEHDLPAGDRYLEALKAKLRRVRAVAASKVPPNVITMNTRVRLYDLDLREPEEYTLVYPEDADVALDRISVLAPVGTAILGHRVGDVVEWEVPAGLRRLRVEKVVHEVERDRVLSR